MNTLQQTSTYVATDRANLEAQQSTLVSANTTAVATDLSASETQEKALLSVMSVLGQTNLFTVMQG